MAEVITTRPMNRADVQPVLDLLRVALGEPPLLKRTPELLAWKHFENPFGESIALVAEAGDRIVGLRTFMRWELHTPGGDVLRCVRAVDTATHPDFHRRGIFRRLTEEALEDAAADGVNLVFNTPNASSGSGYLKMGWSVVGPIGVMVRPTLRVLSKRPIDDDEASVSPVDVQALDDRPPLGLRTPRSEAYLRWRFVTHPKARYFEVRNGDSAAVLRSNVRNERPELLIADLFGPNVGPAIRRAARQTTSAYVAAWFSAGSPERMVCVRAGLLPVPGVRALTLMTRVLGDVGIDVTSLESWDLALSDLELL